MSTPIPLLYTLFFTTIDLLLATTGILSTLFSPQTFLVSQVFLLRLRPNDILLWKILQASILVRNVGMLVAFVKVMAREGGLKPGVWTRAEWGSRLGWCAQVR